MSRASWKDSLLVRAVLYVALVIGLSMFLTTDTADAYLFGPMRLAVARITAFVLDLVGLSASVHGQVVRFRSGAVEIVNGCTGVDVMVLLSSAVLVFPASWRAKCVGVLMSIAIVFTINFIRVLTLCYLVSSGSGQLETNHVYIWPAIITIVCLGTLLFWIERFAVSRP